MKHPYKKLVWRWTLASSISLLIWSIVLALIDPIGILGTPIIPGINNNKIKEDDFIAIAKAYQVAHSNADIIYIGSSRVLVGMKANHPGIPDNKIFNMGIDALSLADMKSYLEMIYSIHPPQDIYIGLDFFQFGISPIDADFQHEALQKRLTLLQHGGLPLQLFTYRENMSMTKYAIPTIKASHSQPEVISHPHGWDITRGQTITTTPAIYDGALNQFLHFNYKLWQPDTTAIQTLRDIVQFSKAYGVNAHFFFNPLSADLHALLDVTGHLNDFYEVKRQAASITPIMDFAFVNEYTSDRSLFYDASHYQATLGDKIPPAIDQGAPLPFMLPLTPADLENSLAQENRSYQEWKAGHSAFMQVLQDAYQKQAAVSTNTENNP